MNPPSPRRALLVRAGTQTCALAVEHVVETLRPLAVNAFTGLPPFVRGVAVVRGEPVPVVELARFLSGDDERPGARWVVLRIGTRRAVLAVDAVLGVGEVGGQAPAPLLERACGTAVEALSAVDRELLLVLDTARVVPEEAWAGASGAEEPRT